LPAKANLPRFINADLIAAGLAPFTPETAAVKAGRLMLQEIEECRRRGESFALETTLSGLSYLRQIRQWRDQGYRVSLYFLKLPDADTAIARVASRVRQGGHNIRRRPFDAGSSLDGRIFRTTTAIWWMSGLFTIMPKDLAFTLALA